MKHFPEIRLPNGQLPDGALADQWLRRQRRAERDRWKHIRDPHTETVIRQAGFAIVTGQHAYATGDVSTTATAALPANPTAGSVVCVAAFWYDGVNASTTATAKDANNNNYTLSPNSPSSVNGTTTGASYVFYLLNAPANADKTVTITWGLISVAAEIWVVEFSVSGGTAAFDADNTGNGASGTAINSPTITVNGSGELLFCHAAPQNCVTAIGGAWTSPETLSVTNCGGAGYILSASANTAVNMTQSASGSWDAMGMSFSFTASGGLIAPPGSLPLIGIQ